jgi:hypothetical protein
MLPFSLWVVSLLISSSAASSPPTCQLKPLNSCERQDLVKLEEKTFKDLDRGILRYQDLLDKHLAKLQKGKAPAAVNSCFSYHFTNYYLKAIRSFAKGNKGYFCSQHLPLLYSSINSLVDKNSVEGRLIKAEKAKMDLLEQAMNVSEALLYFKNKHTK